MRERERGNWSRTLTSPQTFKIWCIDIFLAHGISCGILHQLLPLPKAIIYCIINSTQEVSVPNLLLFVCLFCLVFNDSMFLLSKGITFLVWFCQQCRTVYGILVPNQRLNPRPQQWKLLLFSYSAVSNSLWPHELKHASASLSFTISWSFLKLMSIQ